MHEGLLLLMENDKHQYIYCRAVSTHGFIQFNVGLMKLTLDFFLIERISFSTSLCSFGRDS